MLDNAVMLLWDTDAGRETTAQLMQTIGEVVYRPKDRARLLSAIGLVLQAQHEASYFTGIAEQLITVKEKMP